MTLLVEIPDNKVTFGLEVLKNLAFVKKVNPLILNKLTLWNDLEKAANEVKLHKQGKIKLKTAQELLDEL